jgi:hypothetical protein
VIGFRPPPSLVGEQGFAAAEGLPCRSFDANEIARAAYNNKEQNKIRGSSRPLKSSYKKKPVILKPPISTSTIK